MSYRPGDRIDLQGDLLMVTPNGQIARLHIDQDGGGLCLRLESYDTGDVYDVCLDAVTTTPPTPATGEVLHGTAMIYGAFGPDGSTPSTGPSPDTEDALAGTAMIYAAFGEIEV